MELLVAAAIGLMTAVGIYLVLRLRTFPVIVGLTMISYACNVFIFVSGRIVPGLPPILSDSAAGYTDPMPQALVLTAIVISFGMTAVLVMMGLGAFLEAGDDRVDLDEPADAQKEAAK